MTTWAIGALAVAVVVAWAGPRVLRSAPARVTVQIGTAAALVVAVSTGLVLVIAADLAFTQLQALVLEGPRRSWRPSAAAIVVGATAAAVAAFLLWTAARSLLRSLRGLYLAWRETLELNPTGRRLVVVEDPVPAAFAVTGYPGQVVVSTAMLEALDAREQVALLAHEEAHLRHYHQVYVQLAALAAAANPLLRPLASTVATATERWADEAAAAAVGDRGVAARAVARAALASHRHHTSPAVSAVSGSADESQLACRVNTLMAPPAGPAHRLVAAAAVALCVCVGTSAMTVVTGHDQVEHIETSVLGAGR